MFKTILAAAVLAAVSTAASAQTAPAPAQDHSAHAAAPAAPAAAMPTVNSPMKDLMANPASAAVINAHLPGLTSHPAFSQVQEMTLAQIAPYSQGAITPEIIAAIDTDLKALPAAH